MPRPGFNSANMARGAGAAVLLAATLLAASPATAQERDYCPARPGLGDTPCTIAPGRVSVEIGVADWQHDSEAGVVTDTITLADALVRAGIDARTEIDIGWTPYVRERTRTGGAVAASVSSGDVTLGLRRNLASPDGGGVSAALLPFVTLPVGRAPGGAGDWSAGVELPASFDLGHGLSLQSTTTIAAAVDEDRHGRHFAASEVVGLGIALTDSVSLTLEGEVDRDEDPSGSATDARAGASLAWSASDRLQLDIGAVAGLDRGATGVEIYAGISRRF